MDWSLIISLGSTAGVIALAFLYTRARVQAAQAAQYKRITGELLEVYKVNRTIIAGKEEYIRELEKTVLGSLPAGKLADRLNRMFAGTRDREAGPLSATKPSADPTGT